MATIGKRFKADQIVNLLSEIGVMTTHVNIVPETCKYAGKSYYRWLNIYGGLKVDQAKRFEEIEAEMPDLKSW